MRSKITSGFGFLDNTAGFGINQTLIPYSESDTYGRVFLVGLLNTLLVAAIGIVLATILGFVVGIARLSPNWLLARLAGGYVELIRNLPLLFQILFWYLAVLGTLPGPRQSIAIGWQPVLTRVAECLEGSSVVACPSASRGGAAIWPNGRAPELFLNNRGLIVPAPVFGPGWEFVAAALSIAVLAAIVLRGWASRRQASDRAAVPGGLGEPRPDRRIAADRAGRARISDRLRAGRSCAASISSAACG